MRLLSMFLPVALFCISTGCATVNVTRTARTTYEPSRPDEIAILMTSPRRKFTELGTVTTANWKMKESAKMHKAMRTKAAPLGADAVVITDSGVAGEGSSARLWCTGYALRYFEQAPR